MPLKESSPKKGVGALQSIHNVGTTPIINTKPRVWASCKEWSLRHKRRIVWLTATIGVVICSILWYRHVQYTREVARKKSKWWWSH